MGSMITRELAATIIPGGRTDLPGRLESALRARAPQA
jgi:hypothetical protein